MRKPLTTISVSSFNDFQNDRLRWVCRWIENRVPRSVPQALTIGTMIHKAFERSFNDSMEVSKALKMELDTFKGSLLTEKEQKSYDELEAMIEPLQFWTEQFPIKKTLEVEQPFEYTLTNGLIFQGRPDRVVEAYGKVMHFQHKTLAGSADVGAYITLARRSMHELLYGDYLSRKYSDLPYGGTIYNIVRKLKYRSKTVTKAEPLGKILNQPEAMFLQTVIPIDKRQQEQAITDIDRTAYDMKDVSDRYLNRGALPASNRAQDSGYFGHGIDAYTPVILGEASLDDDSLFMDRADLYAPAEESAE